MVAANEHAMSVCQVQILGGGERLPQHIGAAMFGEPATPVQDHWTSAAGLVNHDKATKRPLHEI
jgi:hypothetical protein